MLIIPGIVYTVGETATKTAYSEDQQRHKDHYVMKYKKNDLWPLQPRPLMVENNHSNHPSWEDSVAKFFMEEPVKFFMEEPAKSGCDCNGSILCGCNGSILCNFGLSPYRPFHFELSKTTAHVQCHFFTCFLPSGKNMKKLLQATCKANQLQSMKRTLEKSTIWLHQTGYLTGRTFSTTADASYSCTHHNEHPACSHSPSKPYAPLPP